MMDVAKPFKVATFTRDTRVLSDSEIDCVAGPTSFIGAGMASVMEKICSEFSGKVLRNAQKNGDERVSSSEA